MDIKYEMNFLIEDIDLALPSYTSTLTVCTVKRNPIWKKPDEIIEYLKNYGSPIRSKASLINYERRGELTAKRIGKKKVYYDLNEINRLFVK